MYRKTLQNKMMATTTNTEEEAPPSYDEATTSPGNTVDPISMETEQITTPQTEESGLNTIIYFIYINKSESNNDDDDNQQHLTAKEMLRNNLKSGTACFCIPHWIYLHIVMILLIFCCIYNARIRWIKYYPFNDDVLFLVSTILFISGPIFVIYGVYGMYNCIPLSFLLLTIYFLSHIVIDIMIMINHLLYFG